LKELKEIQLQKHKQKTIAKRTTSRIHKVQFFHIKVQWSHLPLLSHKKVLHLTILKQQLKSNPQKGDYLENS
jgi:hypothetical protein